MNGFNDFICRYIYFTYPFGWEELGVVATVAAVIVALFSNLSAKKQLLAALKMQEQSKNISLLEERMKIAEAVRTRNSVSETSVKILYNSCILESFRELQKLELQYRQAESDESTFFDALKITNATEVERRIREFTDLYLDRPDCPKSIKEHFQKYCNENTQYWSPTGFSDDRRDYNYYEIYTQMTETHRAIEEKRKVIVSQMEEYLTNSIKQVVAQK